MNNTYTKDGVEFCKACRANLSQERTLHDEHENRISVNRAWSTLHRGQAPYEHTCRYDALVATSLAYRAMLEGVVNNSAAAKEGFTLCVIDETLVSVEMINECRGILGWEKL
jgi:hypothetical protein